MPGCKCDATLPRDNRVTRVPRNISASVEKRLLNLARQSGEDFQSVLMRYGLERIMYRLSCSAYAKEFVVKGAMLLRVWIGEQYRPTKDLDLLAILNRSSEELNQVFHDICKLTVEEDGLIFLSETIRVREIREDNVYGGMRVTLEARLGKIRIPLQVASASVIRLLPKRVQGVSNAVGFSRSQSSDVSEENFYRGEVRSNRKSRSQ